MHKNDEQNIIDANEKTSGCDGDIWHGVVVQNDWWYIGE